MAQVIFPVTTDFDRKLPYFFAGVGCNYEQEKIERPKGHTNYQWIQTRSGEGVLYLREKKYVLKEGMGMLLFPKEPHIYHKTKGDWYVDWIIFDGGGIADFVRNLTNLKQSEVGNVKDPAILSRKMEDIFQVSASNESMKNAICSQLIYSLLTDILRNAAFQTDKAITGNANKLDAVINYINMHYAEVLVLDTLADIADLTPQYLCTVFKQYTSRTVFQYINMVRVSKSKELLLAEYSMPVGEIAYRTGFRDVSYFCKTFRRLEGKSPMEFRGGR